MKKIVTENKEMAEILNQFFSSVFTKEDLGATQKLAETILN